MEKELSSSELSVVDRDRGSTETPCCPAIVVADERGYPLLIAGRVISEVVNTGDVMRAMAWVMKLRKQLNQNLQYCLNAVQMWLEMLTSNSTSIENIAAAMMDVIVVMDASWW